MTNKNIANKEFINVNGYFYEYITLLKITDFYSPESPYNLVSRFPINFKIYCSYNRDGSNHSYFIGYNFLTNVLLSSLFPENNSFSNYFSNSNLLNLIWICTKNDYGYFYNLPLNSQSIFFTGVIKSLINKMYNLFVFNKLEYFTEFEHISNPHVCKAHSIYNISEYYDIPNKTKSNLANVTDSFVSINHCAFTGANNLNNLSKRYIKIMKPIYEKTFYKTKTQL